MGTHLFGSPCIYNGLALFRSKQQFFHSHIMYQTTIFLYLFFTFVDNDGSQRKNVEYTFNISRISHKVSLNNIILVQKYSAESTGVKKFWTVRMLATYKLTTF